MDLTSLSATMLARAIRTNLFSAVDVMDAYLSRLEEVNPRLNAAVQLADADAARKQAREADHAIARGEAVGISHGAALWIQIREGAARGARAWQISDSS